MTVAFQSAAFTTYGRTQDFKAKFPQEAEFLVDNMTNDFYRSVWVQAVRWGRISEKQLAAVRRGMEKRKA